MLNTSTLNTIEQSPEAQAVLGILKQQAISGVTTEILAALPVIQAANPTADAATLETLVENQVWHETRVKWGWLGFLVDILRNIETTEEPVKQYVTAIVATVLAGENPSSVSTGA